MNWLAIAPWLLSLVFGIGGFTAYEVERGNYESCKAARAADVTAAQEAKATALQQAQDRSDKIITEQAQALAVTANKAGTYVEKIVHIPVTTACADSPAMRAATDGIRELFGASAGGGQPQAGGGAASPVR